METPIREKALKQNHRFATLDTKLGKAWDELLHNSRFIAGIYAGDFDARLFGIYMLETYHYTAHNARNQAIAGARAFDRSPHYLKFCFEHAQEETGHEFMALHDLGTLGFDKDTFPIPEPLPATEVLIAYLYWISEHGNTVQRLGYSYWAENCYGYIAPIVQQVQSHLGLKNSQLTFFTAHATIDTVHAREVLEVVDSHCATEADWQAVERVMLTSLRLMGDVLEAVWQAFQELRTSQPSPYAFLNVLVNPARQSHPGTLAVSPAYG
jgi:thiaminase